MHTNRQQQTGAILATHCGFTLIELMITVAVAAILMSLAAPSFRDIIQNSRASAYANEFISALHYARSEAVKRGGTVRITALNSASASNEWGPGWRIWIDLNGNGTCCTTAEKLAGEELRVHEALGGNASLNSDPNGNELQFQGTGFANISTDFILRLPGCRGDNNRTITVSPTGHISVARDNCS